MTDDNDENEAASAADAMAGAYKSGAAGISFERVGGGKGPGWEGDFYVFPNGVRVQIQRGVCGEFAGSDLNGVLSQAIEALGGGSYTWRARTSDGKYHSGPVTFPGLPKMLPGSDPTAEFQASYATSAQGVAGAQPFYGAQPNGQSPYAQPPMDRLTAGWNWSVGRQSWFWVDDSGAISPPPQGVRPPTGAPGASPYFGTAAGFHQPGSESPVERAILARLEKMEAKQDAARAPDTITPVMTLLIESQKSQTQMLLAMLNSGASNTNANAAREASDRAARATEEAARRKEDRDLLISLLTKDKKHETDPLRVAVDKAIAERVGTNLFGEGKKDDKDDLTHSERMGEKIVDGLTELLSFGKKYLDKEDKPAKDGEKAAKKEDKKPQNGAAKNGSHEGIDDEMGRWLLLLEVAQEAYETGQPPPTAFAMLVAAAKAGNINFENVLVALHKLTAVQLLALLSAQAEPVKSKAAPICSAFGTGDGKAWFEKLLAHARTVPASEGSA